jgi:hypothetical protein
MEWSAMLICKSTITILKPVFDCPYNDDGLAPLWIVGTRDAYVYVRQGDSVFALLQVEYVHKRWNPLDVFWLLLQNSAHFLTWNTPVIQQYTPQF